MSWAPSAMITIVFLFPTLLCCWTAYEKTVEIGRIYRSKTHTADGLTHLLLPFSSFGRPLWDQNEIRSGPGVVKAINGATNAQRLLMTYATPAIKASHPQCLPITSSTKALLWEAAVEFMLSIASQILCNAVGAPIVRSVMDISLSMDPTSPTILRCPCWTAWASVILPVKMSKEDLRRTLDEQHYRILRPEACSSATRPGHSDRNTSAPVRDPSPPQITRASIPSLIILKAALSRPS